METQTKPTTQVVKHVLCMFRDEVEKQEIALTKKAKQAGVAPPKFVYGESYRHEFEVIVGVDPDGPEIEFHIEDCFDLTIIETETLKMPGNWNLIACLSHEFDKIITINSDIELPKHFGTHSSHCDHCQRKTVRTKSYVICNDENQWMQVGASCLKHHLGINPAKYVTMFEAISHFSIFIKDCSNYAKGGAAGSDTLALDVRKVVNLTANTINEQGGYVKAEWSSEEDYRGYAKSFRSNVGEATIDHVNSFLQLSQFKGVALNEVPDNYTQVDAFLTWTKSINPQGREYTSRHYETGVETTEIFYNGFEEWLLKIKDICSKVRIRIYDLNVLIAGYGYFLTIPAREAETAAKKLKNHVGTVGEKITTTVTITDHQWREGDFGPYAIVKMETVDTGDTLIYFGGSKFAKETELGLQASITFTVKKHDVFMDEKSTHIARPKIN